MADVAEPVPAGARHRDLRGRLGGVAVIIPALNEEASLPLVLGDLPDVGRVIVVPEPRRGYGAACLLGLAALAQSVADGVDAPHIVVFLDADYSDHPEFLAELVGPILDGTDDLVLGSRLLGEREPGAMPPQRLFGDHLACFLMRHLFGARYTDLGPFRAIGYRKLLGLGMVDRDFCWTVEMQIKAARAGLRISEIPVPYRRRIGKSKISGTILGSLKAGYKILYVIAKYGRERRSTAGRAGRPEGQADERGPCRTAIASAPRDPVALGDRLVGRLLGHRVGRPELARGEPTGPLPAGDPRPVRLRLRLLPGRHPNGDPGAPGRPLAGVDRRRLGGVPITFLFSDPIEEIDLYRYLWDGSATLAGVDPFRYSPAEVLAA